MASHRPSTTSDILLFGVQGSGKGTQSERLVQEYGYQHFSMGDQLRVVAATQTEIGKLVKSYQDNGKHVPHNIVMNAVNEAINTLDLQRPIIFDGVPRNMEQKEALDAILEELDRTAIAIHLLLDNETAYQRMINRGREDDTPEVIETRLRTFEEKTVPVIEQYGHKGNVVTVDASQSKDKVYQEVKKGLYQKGAIPALEEAY